MTTFLDYESEVRSYSRSFPVVFERAQGAHLYDEQGQDYIDFLAGAGSLNYGHNNSVIKEKLIDYIASDGVTHGLDMRTMAKQEFMETFHSHILEPRQMNYVMQFTGPTGANSVEAAVKIARKVKGRTNIIAFTNGFHGVTLGALSLTGNQHHRGGAGVELGGVTRMPFCGYHGKDVDTLDMMDKMIDDPSSGVDHPAAVIVEAVQGEGGLNVASPAWLKKLEKLCHKHDMLLILDDIQAGCGRTGHFFSFEPADISPDIITLSKSLSGYGLPLALVLLKPELDQWKPGEHNGTFRGNNHAFVTAKAAIEAYWSNDVLANEVRAKSALLRERLKDIAKAVGETNVKLKGRGLMQGLECRSGEIADAICAEAFKHNLVIETSGNRGQVVKCLVPLTISEKDLRAGLDVLEKSMKTVFSNRVKKAS